MDGEPLLQARFVGEAGAARALARRLETAFDDDGYPVTCYDVTEDGPVAVEVLFPGLDQPGIEAALHAALGAAPDVPGFVVEPVPDVNWVAKSLEGLSPVAEGRFFIHGSHDRPRRRPSGINIEIDANVAFGTGHHGSTLGCLAALDDVLKRHRPRRVLDLGTGTGVLAIACARVLHRPVLATDIDDVAVRTARANAVANGVGPLVNAVAADGLRHPAFTHKGPFDLVLANIIARPLAALAPSVARHLAERVTVVLSGLRPEDGRRIVATYRPFGLALDRRIMRSGWLTLVLRR